jgi:hypothetical protein
MYFKNINDLLYNYFRWEIIHYMLENYKKSFQSYIRLIYGKDIILLLLCEQFSKVVNHVL